jgi:metal-responsive CopG/Arc/MetJ family transcriptional regulator
MTPISTALSDSLSEIAPPNFHGRSETIAEISRKWLAGIDSTQFQACHEYLLAVRLARHMTKTDVVTASMVDGDPATVSKIESGTYGEPGFRTMIRLARGYGISVSSLERFFV